MTPAATAAAALASFATSLDLSDVPAAVVERTELHLLDTLGAAIAGAAAPEAAFARSAYGVGASGDGAPVWGTPFADRPATAALVNGVAAHSLELDDSDGCDHSGAVVVPAALAAAELGAASGADLVRAVLLGYEVARRVMDASGGYAAVNAAGWHSTGTCGTFGAAAAAAVVLGLDAQQLTWALGLAGSSAAGLWAFIDDGAMSKRLHAGRAAENGLTAALLARSGFTGPSRIFEAEWGGWFSTFAPGTARTEELLAGLGESWRVELASIKPHASCRDTHSAVDVVLDHPEIADADVAEVVVAMNPFAARMCGSTQVDTVVDAQMSLPYCVAVALLHRRVGPAEVGASVRDDPRTRAVLARIRVQVEDGWADDALPRLTVRLHDGSTRAFRGTHPLGSTARPLGRNGIVAKFTDLAGRVLPADRTDALAEAVLTAHRLPGTDALRRLLTADAVPAILT